MRDILITIINVRTINKEAGKRNKSKEKWRQDSGVKKIVSQKSIVQPAFTCSKLTIETLEQGVKYVQT